MTLLELILCEICEKIHSLRPAAVPTSGTASQNISLYNFLEGARKFFSIKEKRNVLLGSALSREAAGLRFGSDGSAFPP